MDLYRNLYYQMVRASERALRELEQQNFGNARNILIAAQQEAEEQYLRQTDDRNCRRGILQSPASRRGRGSPRGNPPPILFWSCPKENGLRPVQEKKRL